MTVKTGRYTYGCAIELLDPYMYSETAGGYEKASKCNKWPEIFIKLGIDKIGEPSCTLDSRDEVIDINVEKPKEVEESKVKEETVQVEDFEDGELGLEEYDDLIFLDEDTYAINE
ncbi:hypothetical protein E3N88_08007 [Mikania micrantha]|uniref:ARID domain-containing protein n=1 Tax=Mikania micrantha TaxID=192012 RepID=A0A5N6PFG5_9ASTR|nr:hypothetical protein E3N88_08007 [Mikania micrantha]